MADDAGRGAADGESERADADLGRYADRGDARSSEGDADSRDDAGPEDTPDPEADSDSVDDIESVDDADPVEVGVELLANLEHAELSVAAAVDRIETVTTHPATTREILDEAEKRGVVEREAGVLRVTTGSYVSFGSEVVTKEGEFSCRRCGASLSEGHFVQFDAAEHGPFGPECVRTVLGRD